MKTTVKKSLVLMIILCFVLGSIVWTKGEGQLVVEDNTCDHSDVEKTKKIIENATCLHAERYYIAYICTKCGAEVGEEPDAEGEKGDHIPGEPEKENEVAATCQQEGSYDLVVRCSTPDCGYVMSREHKTVPKADHTPGEPEKENEVAATCQHGASYDLVTRCTECGAELSRETVEGEKAEHTPGEPEKENEVAATCQQGGSYDLVTRCTVCGAELSRETVEGEKAEHTPGEPEKENEVAATCQHGASYDLVTRCTECGAELSRKTVVVEKEKEEHIPGEPIIENTIDATCTKDGSYDVVTRCTKCYTELSRRTISVEKKGHVGGTAVTEHETPADNQNEGSYESVIYCTVCGVEVSRVKETIPKLDNEPEQNRLTAAEEALRAARAAEAAAQAAAQAAAAAAAGNIPLEPATTIPIEQPTRPASAPVPVPAPQRPVVPVVPAAPGGIPVQSGPVNIEIAKISDVDDFVEDLISELSKDNKIPALDTKTLTEVLNGVNVSESDPSHEKMPVETAVKKLAENYKVYHSNGKEVVDIDTDLSQYDFLCAFEQLKLQRGQAVDNYGKPLPFKVAAVLPALADMKAAEIEDTMMMVYDPISGEIALIQLDAASFDTSRTPPELNVTIPFQGLFTFIRK